VLSEKRETAPRTTVRAQGKGAPCGRSLSVARGGRDIVMFGTADYSNFREQFVYGNPGTAGSRCLRFSSRRRLTAGLIRDSSQSVATWRRGHELMAKGRCSNFFCPGTHRFGFASRLAGGFAFFFRVPWDRCAASRSSPGMGWSWASWSTGLWRERRPSATMARSISGRQKTGTSRYGTFSPDGARRCGPWAMAASLRQRGI